VRQRLRNQADRFHHALEALPERGPIQSSRRRTTCRAESARSLRGRAVLVENVLVKMAEMLALVISIIVVALIFDYINGFTTRQFIATIVSPGSEPRPS